MTRQALRFLPAAVLVGTLMAAPAVQAGRSCETRPLTVQTLSQGLDLAQRTAEALEAEYRRAGTRVVALARAGQDLSKYQLRYSHMGWAYRTDEGPWRVVHKLNQCGTAVASIYRQGLGEFFLDDLWRHEAVWEVPAPALQAPLLALLKNPAQVAGLHERNYNMVSYVWGRKYQQSNQWAIEVLAVAAEPTVQSRERAQAWLQFKGYTPSTLRIGPLTRLGGRVGMANVAFDDHPNDKRFSDRIETVTVDSVFEWLPRAGLAGPMQQLGGAAARTPK